MQADGLVIELSQCELPVQTVERAYLFRHGAAEETKVNVVFLIMPRPVKFNRYRRFPDLRDCARRAKHAIKSESRGPLSCLERRQSQPVQALPIAVKDLLSFLSGTSGVVQQGGVRLPYPDVRGCD